VITLEDSRVARIEEFNDEETALAAAASAR
jgi:hypothetical protein